jgi:hypothetical protein
VGSAHTTEPRVSSPAERRVEAYAAKVGPKALLAVFAGVMIVLLCSLGSEQWRQRLEASYLVAFSFYLTITLGALFFVVLQHLVKAGWSVTVRRVAEGISKNILLCLVLFIPVVLMAPKLYPWTQWGHDDVAAVTHHGAQGPEAGHGEGTTHDPAGGQDEAFAPEGTADHVLSRSSPDGMSSDTKLEHPHPAASKSWYLSFPQFLVRFGVYFLVWLVTAWYFSSTSRAQDATGDLALTRRMEWWSPLAMIGFAFSCAFGGIDLLMSMDPAWYSTMFGVYWFAGCAVSAMAALSLTLYGLQRQGLIKHEVTPEHYHDVGKLMFAFIVFWAYIAYSQFMLIWYGNIPEEVGWFQRRVVGDWLIVAVWLIFGHFFIPFFCLLSRFPKRHPYLLAVGAMWVLLVHYTDLMWVILPQPPEFLASIHRAPQRGFPVPLLDLGMCLSLGGLYVWSLARNLSGASLIPERDPRLAVSLAHENY